MSKQKDLKQILTDATERGWYAVKTNGAFFFSASTPSDHRAIKNIESRIRRIEQGLPVR